jgi:energy-coupling factor transporter ATP-binding protein EcfA2
MTAAEQAEERARRRAEERERAPHPPPAADDTPHAADREPSAPGREPYHRAPNLTRAILERAKLPWVELRIDEISEEIARVRVGAYVVLVAPEGSGKSSLLLQLGALWARTRGVFVYFTVELDEEEAAGRIVGQALNESWEMVLRGCVSEEDMTRALDLPRLTVIAGEHAALSNIARAVEDLREEFPDVPIVVGVDYLQAIDEGNAREERQRVSNVSKRLRKLAKELGVVILGVSQTSRGNRDRLRNGEAVGADTTAMGAETSQLERDAYVTLALGGFADQPDGTRKLDLSVGKTRMGTGDKVFPVVFDGRSGRFAFTGEARRGSEVRAERASKDDEAKVHAAKLAIPAALAQAPEPMFPDALAKEIDKRASAVRAALKQLQADPESGVVRVRWQQPPPPGAKPRRANGAFPYWDRERAEASGVEIFPVGFGGGK